MICALSRHVAKRPFLAVLPMLALLQGYVSALPEGIRKGAVRGWSDCYFLSNGRVTATICPQVGGRILQYQLGDDTVVAEQRQYDGKTLATHGKCFHPGGYQLDVLPYLDRKTPGYDDQRVGPWDVEVIGPHSLRLSSSRTSPLGFHLTKTLSMDRETGALTVAQTITNHSQKVVTFGLWDRTWTSGARYVFFPVRTERRFKAGWDFTANSKRWRDIPKIMDSGQYSLHEGLFVIDGKRSIHNAQIVAECDAGWMAWVKEDLLYVKRFPFDPDATYGFDGGANVSVFTGGIKLPIVEIEPSGPVQAIPPGESRTFRVVWELRRLGQSVRQVRDLVRLAEHIATPSPTE